LRAKPSPKMQVRVRSTLGTTLNSIWFLPFPIKCILISYYAKRHQIQVTPLFICMYQTTEFIYSIHEFKERTAQSGKCFAPIHPSISQYGSRPFPSGIRCGNRHERHSTHRHQTLPAVLSSLSFSLSHARNHPSLMNLNPSKSIYESLNGV
jgi:hypothetical protein